MVGDVNSTMACALVAVKRGIPVAHVEAGLRSFDRAMPEEINRIVTDAISDLLLVSEPAGLDNLEREGVPRERVRYCGNVMIDSLVDQLPSARALDMPARIGLRRGEYAVATLHRPSNVDVPARLRELITFLQRVGTELPVVFPVHPRTEKMLTELDLRSALAEHARVRLIPPLGYREFLSLMDGARLVVTDSGGIQEETTYLGVPCVTLRANTERPVTITRGTNTLVGDDLAHAWSVCASICAARSGMPSLSRAGTAAPHVGSSMRSSRAGTSGITSCRRRSTALDEHASWRRRDRRDVEPAQPSALDGTSCHAHLE